MPDFHPFLEVLRRRDMDLGDFEMGFKVRDIHQSLAFYAKVGFEVVDGCVEDRTVTLQNGACRIALYQGYDVDPVFLNFREGDVHGIAHELTGRGLKFDKPAFTGEDGGSGALLKDPDGNVLYFCSHPGAARLNPT
jgi:hypothetical protein